MELQPYEIKMLLLRLVCLQCGKRCSKKLSSQCEFCKHVFDPSVNVLKEFESLPVEKQERMVEALHTRPIDEEEMCSLLHEWIDSCDLDELREVFTQTFACVKEIKEDDELGSDVVVFQKGMVERW